MRQARLPHNLRKRGVEGEVVGDASVCCTSVIAMLPFVLAWPLLRVSASVLYIHIQVQDTVYEWMDLN